MEASRAKPTKSDEVGAPALVDPGRHVRRLLNASVDQQDFTALRQAFQPYGGFASCDEVMRRLRPLAIHPRGTLTRWIVSRSVVNVSWCDDTLLPTFQFDLEQMSVRPACTRVIDELACAFDDREVALWFATPNAWLDYAAPVTLLSSDEFAVLQAARVDRFSRGY
jgi:hypothetical protein